jgi:hypothetical protein
LLTAAKDQGAAAARRLPAEGGGKGRKIEDREWKRDAVKTSVTLVVQG